MFCLHWIPAMWMLSNRLQLNTAKTEVLWCASSRRQHQLPQVALRVGTDCVTPTSSVRDLGIYVDSDVSTRTSVSRTVSGCLPYYASCGAFVARRHKRYYCRWSSRWCCRVWTMATRRSPVYKQCDSDPIPTWLHKDCSALLVPTITNIVNLSLSSGNFHYTLKESVISPLLKKPVMDCLTMSYP